MYRTHRLFRVSLVSLVSMTDLPDLKFEVPDFGKPVETKSKEAAAFWIAVNVRTQSAQVLDIILCYLVRSGFIS